MTVKYNSKKNTYSIWNKQESYKNVEFSHSFCNIYYNNFGIDIYQNDEKIILVLTKSSSNNTPFFNALDYKSWNKFIDSVENLNCVSRLDKAINIFFGDNL